MLFKIKNDFYDFGSIFVCLPSNFANHEVRGLLFHDPIAGELGVAALV